MPEFNITASFEVWCERCGAPLCNNVNDSNKNTKTHQSFTIEPCERCLEEARSVGYEEGLSEQKD